MSFKTNLTDNGDSGSIRVDRDGVARVTGEGTWGSGTLTPKRKNPLTGNYVAYGTTTLTDDGSVVLQVRAGDELIATLSGATSPDLDVHWECWA